MSAKETVWGLEDHTKGKHLVLKYYLDAWFPILSRWNGRVLFIDGFSGPGRYKGGEEGSPLIAIRCVREHTASGLIKEVVCIFIEADKARADYLKTVLAEMQQAGQIPEKCKPFIEHGTFDDGMTKVLDIVDQTQQRLAPAFVMIDPFGVSDTPMSVIERLFRNDRIEGLCVVHVRMDKSFQGDPRIRTAYGQALRVKRVARGHGNRRSNSV
jgi:three-Cys-motif partner protein